MSASLAGVTVRFVLMLHGLTLLAASSALAEKVMLDNSNPPFMYAAKDGQAAGLYPAILAEAFRRMGTPLELEAVPWRRALAAIDAGAAGVGGMYKSAERLRKYDYSDKLSDECILVYAPRGSAFDFKDVSSLYGKRVGVIRGWSYGEDFDAAVKAGTITADEAEDDARSFAKLANGRIDAALAIRESGDAIVSSPGMARAVAALPRPLAIPSTFLAFNKSAGKRELLARLNAVLSQMRADHSLDELIRKFMSRDEQSGQSSQNR